MYLQEDCAQTVIDNNSDDIFPEKIPRRLWKDKLTEVPHNLKVKGRRSDPSAPLSLISPVRY